MWETDMQVTYFSPIKGKAIYKFATKAYKTYFSYVLLLQTSVDCECFLYSLLVSPRMMQRTRLEYLLFVWRQSSSSTMMHPGRCQRSAPCGHWLFGRHAAETWSSSKAEQSVRNCQTRCQCFARTCPLALWEYWTVVCLSVCPNHPITQHVVHMEEATDTNTHTLDISGLYLFSLIHSSFLVVIFLSWLILQCSFFNITALAGSYVDQHCYCLLVSLMRHCTQLMACFFRFVLTWSCMFVSNRKQQPFV